MRKVFSDYVCAGLAQLFLGGTLANLLGRLWALRVSIAIMIVGVYVSESCRLGPIYLTHSALFKLSPIHSVC
jgi:hypothetical protein